jgi:hypothetical protein
MIFTKVSDVNDYQNSFTKPDIFLDSSLPHPRSFGL